MSHLIIRRRIVAPMLRLAVALVVAVGLLAPMGSAPAEVRAADAFFDQTFGDFPEELQLAKEQGKDGLLLFFEMDECPFCKRMKDTVLNRAEVQEFYDQHFLVFSVDIEGDIEVVNFAGMSKPEKAFAFEDHRVRATPVFLFVNLEGEPVVRYTGATSSVDEFMWLGEYVVNDLYEDYGSFTRYKRERRAER